jgi:hypothetical protein
MRTAKAPSRPARLLAVLTAIAVTTLVLAASAYADYEQVGLFGQSGSGAQLYKSTGAAVNITGAGGVEPGSVYTTAGNRVSRYNAKGEIKEVWGWGVIGSGPDLPNEVDTLKVSAGSGTYELQGNTARGWVNFTKGSKVLTLLRTDVGAFHVGDSVSYPAFPSGTTIVAVGSDTIELSAPSAGDSSSAGGQQISATETTTPIPYKAEAAEVKAALLALPAFEAGDLSVTGGPGDAGGTIPYQITFEGAYAGSPVSLSSTQSTLAGGVPSSSVAIKQTASASTPGFQRCRVDNGDTCAAELFGNPPFQQEEVGNFFGPEGVAVDQSTGYVYVLNQIIRNHNDREHNLIEVFSADGSEVIARFGDAAAEGETVEKGPDKMRRPLNVVVDDDGKVHIGEGGSESRVMCFRPETAGDYEHYVYCGRSQDVQTGFPLALALDDAGHLYVANQEFIEERSLAEPAAPALCTYLTHGQLHAMTTNPVTGEVFYFNGTESDRSVHRLKPCEPAKGKFEEAQAKIKVSPPAIDMHALAFNPALSWLPNRPAGILYGADAEWHRETTPEHYGLGYIVAPAEVRLPTVESESVSNTRTTSTILHGEINPNGFATHYVFQYLSEAQYEANPAGERFAGAGEAPSGGGEIGGGSIGEAVVSISGLTPDTAYRFRVVATSECNGAGGAPCVAEGVALDFATYPLFPPGLPDHRAYEMVSPAQKYGGEVVPAEPLVSSCITPAGSGECKPNSFGNIFPMQSTPDGEAVSYLGQPFNPFEGVADYDSYVSRRTASGWQTTALIPAQPSSGVKQVAFDTGLDQGILALSNSSLALQPTSQPGSLTPLLSKEPPNRTGNFQLTYAGHSADFSRIFFAANDSLTEATPFAPEPPDPGASKNDLYEWHEGQLTVVNVAPGNATVLAGASYASISPDTHAVSEDGLRIYFKDEAGNLYLRESGEATRLINHPGHFLSATPDGSEVLLDDGCLYSVESESCSDLTEGQGGFKGMLGQSKDLSRIYFADGKALAAGAEAGTCTGAPGNSPQSKEEREGKVPPGFGCNIYLYEAEAPVQFVATVAASNLSDWAASPATRTAEASYNGRFLAFASHVSLTGYDNLGPCERSGGERIVIPCAEAFLYDSTTEELTCASCNPTGEAPLGNTTLRRIEFAPESLPQPRYLTDEGRLYFDTQDSLSSRDTNEGVEDVYEFAPRGTGAQGTCQREAGCAFLISAGTEPVDSNLIAVDEAGKNVFFDTRDKLALKDKDELLDIYDAREGGGIAAESEIARAECQGENCQAPVSPPNDQTPASSTFEGAGNVKEAPAAKKHKHAKKHKKKAKKHARSAKRNHGGVK